MQNRVPAVDNLVDNGQEALQKFLRLGQDEIDNIVRQAALAGLDQHMELAKLAVEDTGRGVYEDKVVKNIFATEYIYHDIKYLKTVGTITQVEEGYTEIAEPAGVIAALTPVTNPTSTTLFKGLIALKTRNPIIFSFHPSAQKCSARAADVLREAAVKAGAPEHCIQWIEQPSIEDAQALIHHPGIALILATGGEKMVQAAYSSGRPALGVGPGNVPCYIEKSAKLKRAVNDLVMSKTFDNGMICASEQAVIVDREIAGEVERLLVELGCCFLDPEDIKKLEDIAVCREKQCSLNPDVVGRSAEQIAAMAGISVPENTKVLIARQDGIGPEHPLSREKLSPILAFYEAGDYREGIALSREMIEFGGLGHSAVIHSEDQKVISAFSEGLLVGRVIVNAPASQGAIGDLYNILTPSLTLGCGYAGRNATTENVTAIDLVNIKRVAQRRVNMQWVKVPPRIYFEPGALQYLSKMPGVERAFIVTDRTLRELGYLGKVEYYLDKRNNHVNIEVFDDVEPNPSLETVQKGLAMMQVFKPDTIIAVGGGSVMDAAKGMWLFYEHPDVKFEFMKLKFLDIRKRTYKYPQSKRKSSLVAVPTTSGSGSEVSAFAVITDKGNDIKYPLADYELTPNVAIIDPDLVMSMPKGLTADTGMDVLTHAVEAYVSVMASDYTDGLALKAIDLVFRYLPRAYHTPDDAEAREKMHNASTIAGMAFTNAFLGVNHALAHKLGGEFDISHGRANAVLMPHVITYNASLPSKITAWPKYEYYQAPERYQDIARYLGLAASTPREGVESLIRAVRQLMRDIHMPATVAECGVDRDEYEAKIPLIAEKAFEDQTTVTNPRTPLVHEMEAILKRAYGPELADTDDVTFPLEHLEGENQMPGIERGYIQ